MLYGLSLHNNPTVQDVWNTLPAWGYPFMASEVAPGPGAAPLLEGGLGQSVVGLGAYSLWDNLLYTEVTAYRSAPQGSAEPLDANASNTTHAISPYWRVALQHQAGPAYMMVGTFGLVSQLYPTGVTGPTNRYSDIGIDGQFERAVGGGEFIGRAAYTHESQTLDAFQAAAPPTTQYATNHVESLHVNASYQPSMSYGLTLGYNMLTGGADSVFYTPGEVTGSAVGRPNSSNITGELTFNVWQNTRLGLQYVAYQKFNGASTNYDGSGRNASDNNTLYAYVWLAF